MAGALTALGGISGNPLTISRKNAKIYLSVMRDDGGVDDSFPIFVFQWNPRQLQDSKDVGWSPQPINGGSHPLHNWGSGGERTIAFSCFMSQDQRSLTGFDRDAKSPDIRTAMRFLRMFTMPRYGASGTDPAKAPRRLRLTIPGSGMGDGGAGGADDWIDAVLMSCDFTIRAAWPDGEPRFVEVSLQFAEDRQYGSAVVYQNASTDHELAARQLLTTYPVSRKLLG